MLFKMELCNILSEIAEKSGINNPSIVCTYETGKGEGYMGIVKMYEISKKDENEDKLSVIVKLSPLSDEIHARLPVRNIFLTEIGFYNKIASCLTDFQREHNVNCYTFVKCFYSDVTHRKEMLIIENLSPKGYAVLNRVQPMRQMHMKMAFEELAKLHALSFALKHKKPQVYEEMAGTLFDNIILQLYNQMGFDNFIRKLTGNCKSLFLGSEIYDTYCSFADRVVEEFHQSNVPDEYTIILHGDTWCNNILYTHDRNGDPTSAVLIDFQLSKVLSPVMDLSYLFYGCVDVQLLPELNEFLKVYHNTLAETLSKFDLNVDDVYSWSTFLNHWKRYSKYGFIVSFLMRIIMLSTSDESPDLSEAAKKDGDVMMAFLYNMKRENEYNETMKAIVRHYIEEKYIE